MKRNIRKITRRFLSLLIAAATALAAQGEFAAAETPDGNAVESTGKEMPKNPVHHCKRKDDGTDTTDWSYVHFGSYPQTEVTGDALTAAITEASYDAGGDAWIDGAKYRRMSKSDTNNDEYFGDSNYRYFKWERIKWRVLKNDGSTLFVVADKGLDCKDYNEEHTSITWENCMLRSWLNSEFYRTAFSSGEQGAIVRQNVVNEDNFGHDTEGGNDTSDKIFLLSIDEVENPEYGFCKEDKWSDSRIVEESDYTYARGTGDGGFGCYWWLRSPGEFSTDAAFVNGSGEVWERGVSVGAADCACVPALHIDISSDLWSMEDDGTSGSGGGSSTGGSSSGDGSGGGGGGSFTIGEEASGNAGDSVASFFPSTWNLKCVAFPVEISRSEEKDGSYKIKGSIGIGRSDLLDDETKWCQYKKSVDDINKYMGKYNYMEDCAKLWNAKSASFVKVSKFKKMPKLSVAGYFECKYDKNGNLIAQTGKIAANMGWKASTSWQFVTPIGPLYLNLEGGGKLSGAIGPMYDYQKKQAKVKDGSLRATPSISLEGGYGVDKVATVGAKGTISVPLTLIPTSKGEAEAEASLHVKLIFVVDYEKKLASGKLTLWDTTKGKSARGVDAAGIDISDGRLSEMDTSFASYAGAWNGEAKNPEDAVDAVGARQASSAEAVLTDGLLPSSLPMQTEIGGRQVMVFQAYDGTRETLDSSVLMYSVRDGGVWSDPQPVWDNGCSDLYADMEVVNGKLSLVWQKQKAKAQGALNQDADAVLGQMARNSEICYAEFDEASGAFVNQAYVTDNEAYDMMPQICGGTDEVVVAWVRNDAASLMQENGANTIYTARLNGGSFEAEAPLTQSAGSVDSFAAYQHQGQIKAVYASRDEGGAVRIFDEGGQEIESLFEQALSDASGSISGMEYTDGKVAFFSDGTLYRYNPADNTAESFLAGESAFGSTAKYCSNGEKGGYVWSVYDEESDTGRIVASMASEDGFCEPVTLHEKKGTMWRYISPILNQDDSWSFVANAMQTKEGEEDHNALICIERQQQTVVELVGASVNPFDMKDGLTGVDYFVANTGDTAIRQLQMELVLADGTVQKQEIPVTILPGENVADTVYVDLSSLDTAQDVSISIYEKSQGKTADSTVTAKAGQADIEVKGSAAESGDTVTVTAMLKNGGKVGADATLHLYSDETCSKELCAAQKVSVAANGSRQVQIQVKKSAVTYNKNGAAYLTLKADVAGGDYNEDNNVAYAVLYRPKQDGSTGTGTNTKPPVASAKTSIARASVTLKKTSYTYDGKAKKPGATVRLGSKNLTNNRDYKLTYSNNKKVGTATVTITGAGSYTGSLKKTFKIIPKGTSISGKIKAKSRGFTVSWKKLKSASGYQVQYSTGKGFAKKTTKTKTVNKKSAKKLSIGGLKANKTYYVRVRTYQTVKGKKYESAWSKAKKVRTKK